jgi:hypothetical protein
MTLIETMVAMTIGLVLIGGAITIYVQSQANYRTADSLSQLQENVRFALDSMEPDIQLASFWGRNNQPETIDATGVQVGCAGATNAQATALALRLATAVESRDDGYDLACAGSNPRADSDVLIIRHASSRLADAPAAGRVQVESNFSRGRLFDDGNLPGLTDSEVRDVVVNAYYIGASTFDPAVPALRRLALVDGGAAGRLEDQEVIPGVENLQVQFGLDTTGDKQVNRYVDGNHPLAAPGAGTPILAVRLWLLVRSPTDETGQGFQDNAAYAPTDRDLGQIQPGVTEGYPANFRRVAVSKTVFLRNVGGLTGA